MPSRSGASPRLGAASDKWVAIVDDHESMRSSLARAFRLECIRSIAFASAEEYLAHTTPTAPSCLVLDMQLPGMRGLELAQLLERERPPLPPTVFIWTPIPVGSKVGTSVRKQLRKLVPTIEQA